MVDETSIGGAERPFPLTRWTLVRSAQQSPEARRAAMEELLAAYWKPLYGFVRRKGRSIEDAKDAVQGFCAHLMQRDFLERMDPGKGRFRSYMRASMDHYLINEHEKQAAQKRGGGARVVPLDAERVEAELGAGPEEPGAAFDRAWARAVMERALEKLRAEFETGKRRGSFELVQSFFGFNDPPSYAEAAKKHGMGVVQLKAFLHRARERFRELVREEVVQTVGTLEDADEEVRVLREALGR